jgi:hypothetical protein
LWPLVAAESWENVSAPRTDQVWSVSVTQHETRQGRRWEDVLPLAPLMLLNKVAMSSSSTVVPPVLPPAPGSPVAPPGEPGREPPAPEPPGRRSLSPESARADATSRQASTKRAAKVKVFILSVSVVVGVGVVGCKTALSGIL